jgi:hypothetical protein
MLTSVPSAKSTVWSIRQAPAETTALQKRVACLEQRAVGPEREQWQDEARAHDVRFHEGSPAPSKLATHPIFPAHRPELALHSSLRTAIHKEVAEVRNQLDVMYFQVSRALAVEETYIVEFDSIVDRLERATRLRPEQMARHPPTGGATRRSLSRSTFQSFYCATSTPRQDSLPAKHSGASSLLHLSGFPFSIAGKLCSSFT